MVGNSVFYFLDILVGKGYLLVPIVFIAVGVSLLFHLREKFLTGTLLGGLLMLLSLLAIADILFEEKMGGYIGYGIAFLSLKYFDYIASLFLFAVIFAVAVMITFNLSLIPRKKDEHDAPERVTVPAAGGENSGNLMQGVKSAVSGLAASLKKPVSQEMLAGTAAAASASSGQTQVADEFINAAKMSGLKALQSDYKIPPLTLLENDRGKPSSGDVRANANIIQRTLTNFGIDVDMGEVSVGPSVTQYTLKPAEGVKLSRITNLASNLGLALAAHPLRIEAPIPGRSLVGIEVPNKSIAFVGLRSLLTEGLASKLDQILGFVLGRDVTGRAVFADLAKMPHLLIAGSTGSGKSVTIHSILLGMLFQNPPERLRFIMIDPKRVELAYYNDIPHLLTPVIVDAKKAIQALRWAVKEMERRYEVLEGAGVRDILSYNNDSKRESLMPYLVIIVDELADLMTSYPREVEASIVRLAQMARAVGIHLVVSTQRPSVEVITGLIKANITNRIALQVASQIDSRTILDMAGAEKLLGKGDMLFLAGDAAKPRRIQGVYISEPEVKNVTEFLRKQKNEEELEEDIFAKKDAGSADSDDNSEDDEMYEAARELVIQTRKASTSFLQRRLRLGYARAARIIDILEHKGVIGPGEGAKPREVLVGREGPGPSMDGMIEREEV